MLKTLAAALTVLVSANWDEGYVRHGESAVADLRIFHLSDLQEVPLTDGGEALPSQALDPNPIQFVPGPHWEGYEGEDIVTRAFLAWRLAWRVIAPRIVRKPDRVDDSPRWGNSFQAWDSFGGENEGEEDKKAGTQGPTQAWQRLGFPHRGS